MMRRLDAAGAHQVRQTLFFVLFMLLPLLSAVSCSGPPTLIPGQDPSPEAAQPDPNSSPEIVVSPQASEIQCAFVWANQDLPDVGEALRKALLEAGLPEIEAHASALGENCIDPATGSTVRFLPMQTDFSLVIPVESIDDSQELGTRIERILPILEQFPPGQISGPNPGYVRIQFLGKSAETSLFFPLENAQELIRDGLTGSALYSALESQ